MVMCIPIIMMIYVQGFIDKKNYSKEINMAITISSTFISISLVVMLTGGLAFRSINAIEQSKVPTDKVSLTIMDFGVKETADTSPNIRFDKSILAERINYSYSNGDNGLSYTIFKSKYPWVIKFDENKLLSRLNKYGVDLKQEDTSLPSDIKVYSYGKGRSFVLVTEDRVIEVQKDLNGIYDDDFLKTVYKKLYNPSLAT